MEDENIFWVHICLSSKILAAKRKGCFEDASTEEFGQGGWHIFYPSTWEIEAGGFL